MCEDMESKKYLAIVKFQDTKDKRSYVVWSSDILNYSPSHPDDFDRSENYRVIWQQRDGSFDGTYPARIICQASTCEELRDKAKASDELVKLPSNFNSFFENLKRKPKPEPQCNTQQSHSMKRGRASSSQASSKTPASTFKSSKKLKITPEIAKKNRMRQASSKFTVQLEANSDESLQDQETQESSDDMDFAEVIPKHLSGETLILDPGVNSNLQEDRNLSESSSELLDSTKFDAAPDHVSTSSSEDSTEKMIFTRGDLKKKIKEMKIQLKDVEEKFESVKQKHNNEVADLTLRYEKEIRLLRTSIKLSDDSRRALRTEVEELRGKSSHEENKLKAVISAAQELLQTGLSQFSQGPAKSTVKQLFVTPQKSNSSPNAPQMLSSPTCSTYCPETKNSSAASHRPTPPAPNRTASYAQKSNSSPNAPQMLSSPTCSTYCPETKNSSAASHRPTPPAPNRTASYAQKSNSSPNGSSDRSSSGAHLKETKVKGSTLTKAQMMEIAERIRKDLSNAEPLPINTASGKVMIAPGVEIAKKKWELAIKDRSKDTLFVKKLAHAIYGHEGLKQRTVGAGSKDKQVATPTKVDTIVACLHGRLMHMSPGQEVDLSATIDKGKKIIGEKMQDEARKRGEKKNENEDDNKSP